MKKEAKDWTRDELMEEYVDKMTPTTILVNISIKEQQTIIDMSSIARAAGITLLHYYQV